MNPQESSENSISANNSTVNAALKKSEQELISNYTIWYKYAIERKQTKLILLTIFLCVSSISQFIVVDYSFTINFGLDKNSPDFLIELLPVLFISGLVTAALPITTFVDEFKLLEHRLELRLCDKKLSPIIWIILPADFLLTFQAICTIGWDNAKHKWIVTLLGFLVAAIFATATLYTSRGIAASFRQLNEAKKHLQILQTYHIPPVDI